MRFTIITPVFNGLRWLPECVRSIVGQRGDDGIDVEHIILDPGSTDGTREWLAEHATHATLVFEKDAGQTDALIRGFGRASGELLGWLNADDVLAPHALARAAEALHRQPDAVGVSGAALVIDVDGRVTGAIACPVDGTLAGLLSSPHNLAQPSTFFRADAYRRAGGIDRNASLAMDVSLWLRLARLGPFVMLPAQVLSHFRIHDDARSVRDAGKTAREDLRLRLDAGMPLLSPAGVALVRYGYLQPPVARLWHRLRDAADAARGRRGRAR